MAEFHPDLSDRQRAERELAMKLHEINVRAAMQQACDLSTMTDQQLEDHQDKLLIGLKAQELEWLKSMSDGDIDTSDIPEVQDWSGAERGKFYRPVGQCVTLDGVVTSLKPSDLKEGNAVYLEDIRKSIADVTGIPKAMMSNDTLDDHGPVTLPSTEQLVQTLVEKYGIDPDKLRITVVDQVAAATPDLDISVGTVEPANPVFAAMSAMRNQFEHPSLRMVNKQDRSKP